MLGLEQLAFEIQSDDASGVPSAVTTLRTFAPMWLPLLPSPARFFEDRCVIPSGIVERYPAQFEPPWAGRRKLEGL